MLELELRGGGYNKSEHRRGLANLLSDRSDGAIERKHQNISAILIELGFVYISGYKPLRNYQQRLFEAVQWPRSKTYWPPGPIPGDHSPIAESVPVEP